MWNLGFSITSNSQCTNKRVDTLKDFYHEAHEDHEESTGYKNAFVLFVSFVSFVVSISLHLELLS